MGLEEDFFFADAFFLGIFLAGFFNRSLFRRWFLRGFFLDGFLRHGILACHFAFLSANHSPRPIQSQFLFLLFSPLP